MRRCLIIDHLGSNFPHGQWGNSCLNRNAVFLRRERILVKEARKQKKEKEKEKKPPASMLGVECCLYQVASVNQTLKMIGRVRSPRGSITVIDHDALWGLFPVIFEELKELLRRRTVCSPVTTVKMRIFESAHYQRLLGSKKTMNSEITGPPPRHNGTLGSGTPKQLHSTRI